MLGGESVVDDIGDDDDVADEDDTGEEIIGPSQRFWLTSLSLGSHALHWARRRRLRGNFLSASSVALQTAS